jgi:hypothetical protein
MKFGCGWRKISHKSKCRKNPRVHNKRMAEKGEKRYEK